MDRERRDRRNERDRRLIERKKQNVGKMREMLEQLELQKRELEAKYEAKLEAEEEADQDSDNQENGTKTPPRWHAQQQYLRVVRQSDRLRAENQAMRDTISQRDMVVAALEDVANQFAEAEIQDNMRVCPINDVDAYLLADAACRQASGIYLRSSQLPEFMSVSAFGWNDLRCTVGDHLDFAIKKTFGNETAAAMIAKTWRLFTTPKTLMQVAPVIVKAMPDVDYFGESVAIAWVRMPQEKLIEGADDCILYVQSCTPDNKPVMLLSTFNSMNYQEQLLSPQPLHHACYWAFEDLPTMEPAPLCVRVQFGGSMLLVSDIAVNNLIAEFFFNVIRWEMLGIRPNILVWEDDDTSNDNQDH